MLYTRINCRGRVQGVLFRDSARRRARRLGLTGFVRNLQDGSVEIIAAGTSEAIDQLFAWAQHGPLFAHVETCTRSTIELPETFTDFHIRMD